MLIKSKILNAESEYFKTKRKYYKKSYQKLYNDNYKSKKITQIILLGFITLTLLLILIKIFKSNNSIKISVIIPTYNRGKLIGKSLFSVLNQTYKNIEIIIVDDNSSDNTSILVNEIKDKRIKYIKLESKRGASYARNVGIQAATGEYITFQDSDDIYHYDKIEKQINNIIKNKADFDFCKIHVTFLNGKILIIPDEQREKQIFKNDTFNELLKNGNFISTQSILVKNSFIKNCTFDIDMPRLQDYDLIIRMLPNLKISYTNETLVDLYVQKDSISSSDIKLHNAFQKIIYKLKDIYKLNDEQKKYLMAYLRFICKSCLF